MNSDFLQNKQYSMFALNYWVMSQFIVLLHNYIVTSFAPIDSGVDGLEQ